IRAERLPQKQRQNARDPERRNEWLQQQALLQEKLERVQNNIPTRGPDVVNKLREREVVVNVPQQVRQKDQKGSEAAHPNPLIEKYAALLGQQQPHHDGESEDRDRILFLHADAGDHAEPQPVARLAMLGGKHGEIRAPAPQQWLK